MPFDATLLDILACPKCKGVVVAYAKGEGVACEFCGLVYPIKDNIPIMLEDESVPLKRAGNPSITRRMVEFDITAGPNQGQKIKLPVGTCKAIGRSIDDINKTAIFSMDLTTSLDDFTKKVIMNFIAQRSPKQATQVQEADPKEGLGGFKRLPDLILDDPAISRLHAMIFHDETGAGVLDLVSKNGTFVNGNEVESFSLREGDSVEVGSTKFQVHYKN